MESICVCHCFFIKHTHEWYPEVTTDSEVLPIGMNGCTITVSPRSPETPFTWDTFWFIPSFKLDFVYPFLSEICLLLSFPGNVTAILVEDECLESCQRCACSRIPGHWGKPETYHFQQVVFSEPPQIILSSNNHHHFCLLVCCLRCNYTHTILFDWLLIQQVYIKQLRGMGGNRHCSLLCGSDCPAGETNRWLWIKICSCCWGSNYFRLGQV